MKSIRLLFCAFFLLGGLTLQAAPVSQSRALEVAKAVLAAQPATKAAGAVKLIWDGEDIATKSAVQPAFYVFGRDGGGFVIVAELLTALSGIYATMPTSASGAIEPYSVKSGFVSAAPEGHPYVLGTPYDWVGLRSLMRQEDIDNASPDLLENVAQLVADLGAIVKSSFSASGTGAKETEVIPGLAEHFGFNKAASLEYADLYSRLDWEELLMDQLDRHPIFYGGRRNSGAHAFVFDGYGEYDGANVFHVNFGWSGSCNGYYYQTLLEPMNGRRYEFMCAAIIDLYPNPTSSWPRILSMDGRGLEYVYEDVPVAPFGEGGQSFSVDRVICNMGEEAYDGKIKLVLLDKDGQPKEDVFVLDGIHIESAIDGIQNFARTGVTFTQPLAFGDAVAFYYTTDAAGTEWAPIRVVGKNSGLISKLPVFPAAFIQTADSYAVGDTFVFALQNHTSRYSASTWQITAPDGTTVSIPQSEGGFKLTTLVTYITVH